MPNEFTPSRKEKNSIFDKFSIPRTSPPLPSVRANPDAVHFKHPETLYFLFLLLIPILVHLFQLRRFRKEYFTNVRFLKELSIQTRKSSQLKKWLLLATRCLLLAALVFAFAQPFFEAKESNAKTNELYILLDNSFSMQAKGQQGELLRRAVEDLLAHVPEDQTFSLLTNDGDFWDTDIRSIRRDLQQLPYSAQPFSLEGMMAKVRARTTPYKKDVVVITDAQGLQAKDLQGLPPDAPVRFIVPKAERRANVSADRVTITQVLDHFYEIEVGFSETGERKRDIPVSLFDKEKLVAKTLLKADAADKTLRFNIPKSDFNGYVAIEDGGLPYDNTFYFAITRPKRTAVMGIGDDAKAGFLKRIYTADEFDFRNQPPAALDYNRIDEQDAIVLNELKTIPQALQTTLKSFVQRGGNLVVIPAADASVAELNGLLARFGALRFGQAGSERKKVTKIAFGHPLYQTVFERKTDNFQYPEASVSYPITSTTPTVLGFEDGSAFLTALPADVATVYVFASPLDRSAGNFQNSPLIVPTFVNMAQNGAHTGVTALTIGDSRPFIAEAQLDKDEIVNVKNAAADFIPAQQILANKVRLTFGEYPTVAGNYGLFAKATHLRDLGFNYARTEGELGDEGPSLLEGQNQSDSVEALFDRLHAERTDNEIWKWFVALCLLFIVTEVCIQKFMK